MTKPLLLIDVDGPLHPWAATHSKRLKGYVRRRTQTQDGSTYNVWLWRWHGQELLKLADLFELTWCTTWEHEANLHIGPRLGLPELPVVKFGPNPPRPDGRIHRKTATVVEYAAGRPIAWVDDEMSVFDGLYIAENHDGPFLLQHINPALGLEAQHFADLRRFGEDPYDEG